MKRVYLIIATVILFLMGIVFTLAPNRYLAGLGIPVSDPGLFTIARSFGGFYLGFAAFLAVALNQKNLIEAAVISVVLVMTGFLTGRIASLILEGTPAPQIWVSIAIELFLAAWGLIILWRSTSHFTLPEKTK